MQSAPFKRVLKKQGAPPIPLPTSARVSVTIPCRPESQSSASVTHFLPDETQAVALDFMWHLVKRFAEIQIGYICLLTQAEFIARNLNANS